MTQVEVAKELKIDRKTVAEIEKSAIKKLIKAFEKRNINIKMLLGD